MDFDVPPLSSAVRQGLRRRRVVLSLSGGGYRGLFSAHVLERIHREFGNGDLLEKVDLFAGTSIGAIIATALASGCQPARIKQLLLDHGPAIFPSKWLPGLRQAMGKALYDSAPLRAAIKEAMPQAEQSALGQLQVPLLLPAVNWNSSQLHVLASGALPDRDRLGLTLMDAMLASSAAPTYFPAHAAAGHVFVDGGLAANAPDLLALQAARQLWGPAADIVMISVGTANPQQGQDPVAMPRRGLTLVKPLLDLVMAAQEVQAVKAARQELGTSSYLRLNFTQPAAQQKRLGLDIANADSTRLLQALGDECIAALTEQEKTLLRNVLG
ncbi:CBASS cGAMP-activated phospholipase [Delftia acidovorans]|uniref:CBASS cGAMP-activated phospholipase n=1 Tax=Delftia acidovorans TaxID=80866 RepID=UPI003D0A2DB6